MWQYNYNTTDTTDTTDTTSLQHSGVKGMKWGHRKAQTIGAIVSQKNMTAAEREKYARNRIKKVGGGQQAINDERDKIQRTGNGTVIRALGLIGALPLASALLSTPGAAVVGAAFIGNMIAASVSPASRNANRNIDEIKRQAGIADIAVTARGTK